MYQYDDADEIYQPYWVRSRYIYHFTMMTDIMIIFLIIMVCKVLSFAHYIPDGPPLPHVEQESFLHCIWKGPFNIQEEH
jgi:hypothetical protein